ncbi:MAG: hypothetical protein IPN79_16410 [Saprospiraceae bacterium]|nr:hypothetical protein [Saprospiraceae bacterium]
MKTKLNLFYILLASVITVFSCEKTDVVSPNPVEIGDVSQIVQLQNDFAWKILEKEMSGSDVNNILISPLSIHTALLMASNGADGKTKSEILNTLGCIHCNMNDMNQQYNKLVTLLTTQSGHPTVTMTNGYFYDKNRITLKTDFINILEKNFDCTFVHKNFDEANQSKNEINQWVKENTNGKIDGIVDQITPLDVSFLINALYFKSDWSFGFGKESIIKQNFLQKDGKTPEIDFVTGDRNIPFVITSDYAMADLPFKDSTYSLSLILPSSTDKSLDKSTYENLVSKLQYSRLFIGFPKMNLSYKNSLIPSLKSLGISEAFNPQLADFTKMGTAGLNIFINQVQHKAILNIDEKGAEGAAVTSIGFGITSLPPTIIFDKPFYLVLRHIPSGAILFSGFVGFDPSK